MDQVSSELKTLCVLFQGKTASVLPDYCLYRLCRKGISLGGEKKSKKQKAKAHVSGKHQNSRAKLNGKWS